MSVLQVAQVVAAKEGHMSSPNFYVLQQRAHSAVSYAIAKGQLKPSNCESCGDPNGYAHHDNYHKPLDVRWLCQSCHMKLHLSPPQFLLDLCALSELEPRKCPFCAHEWYPRKDPGKICPACKRLYSERKAVTRKRSGRQA